MIPRIGDMYRDWEEIGTKEEIEAELNINFFGPGWYFDSSGDCLLIFPYSEVDDPWIHEWPEDQRFCVWCFAGRNPTDIFNNIIHAPVRKDVRINHV